MLLPALAAAVAAGRGLGPDFDPRDCHPAPDHDPLDDAACTKPVDDIVAVATDSSYIATIACNNCPYVERNASDVPRVVRGDYQLVRIVV